MSQTLSLANFDPPNIRERSKVGSAVTVGDTNIKVNFSDDFGTGDFLYLSTLGTEAGERLVVSGVVDSENVTVNSPGATKPHNQYDEAALIFGDQIKVYRASNVNGTQPADSSFDYLDTVDIDFDQASTTYVDAAGDSTYWYKYIYRNSSTAAETFLPDSLAVRGGGFGNYCSIQEIRDESGFQYAPYITDEMIDRKRQAAQDEINGALDEFYDTPFQAPVNDFLRNLCVDLASGLLLLQQYGQTNDNSTANGQAKVDQARADLQKLVMKERVLTDKAGNALDSPGSSGGVDGWPNSSTATTSGSQGGAPRVFRMSDVQGRQSSSNGNNTSGNLYYGRKW